MERRNASHESKDRSRFLAIVFAYLFFADPPRKQGSSCCKSARHILPLPHERRPLWESFFCKHDRQFFLHCHSFDFFLSRFDSFLYHSLFISARVRSCPQFTCSRVGPFRNGKHGRRQSVWHPGSPGPIFFPNRRGMMTSLHGCSRIRGPSRTRGCIHRAYAFHSP